MGIKPFKLILFIYLCCLLFGFGAIAQHTYEKQHIEVSLRMIGHQILLNSNDSTSLVLPIERENDRYRIQFESEFGFNPEDLVAIVGRVVRETKMSKGYIVEVEKCGTGEIVYSYEMGDLERTDIIPCKTRDLSKDCYSLLFTLIEVGATEYSLNTAITDPSEESFTDDSPKVNYTYIILPLLLIAGVFFFLWKKKAGAKIDPNVISIGKYRFNKKNAELVLEEQRIELTGKEADLLLLLYNAVNTTIKRERIQNLVWGDEGDYVGRTLDVFISKLRKKLEADPSVKIVNIRGVGYKLVLDV